MIHVYSCIRVRPHEAEFSRNADLTSIWWISQSSSVASAKRSLKDSNLATGEKVSSKSTPSSWVNPFATSLARKRPSAFFLKTHLDLTAFLPLGSGSRHQTFSLSNASISYWHASTQSWALSDSMASLYVKGSPLAALRSCAIPNLLLPCTNSALSSL